MAERTVMQAALFYEFASIVASSAATLAARRRSTGRLRGKLPRGASQCSVREMVRSGDLKRLRGRLLLLL